MSLDIAADFKAYQERVTSSLVSVTRSAAGIANHDLSFHRSMSEKVSKSLDCQNAHLLRLTSKLLKAATKDTNVRPPTLHDQESIEDNWKSIVDVVDDLLEKADANLDEFDGVLLRMSPARPATPETPASSTPVRSRYQPMYSSAYNVPKPQLLFERQVDNDQTGFWKPLLKTKPHAIVPLEKSIGSGQDGYKHPYAYEIEHLEYPPSVYQEASPIPYDDPSNAEPVWVDTQEGVLEMLEELKKAGEIAIDLEHNDKNSYVGLVSLMQISTRDKDWIVDTLKPWRENLQVLNEVFADPNIVKVFHGSTSDMVWLQRDLGLYVVGLFDTYHACAALNFPGRGLAFLLMKYCNFPAQKQYQLSDWRIRPLPKELLEYARSDTHFLLYIFDNLRNELLQNSTPDNNLIDYVCEASKKEALQVYERHVYDKENGLGPHGWLGLLLKRGSKTFDKQQLGIFRELHEWRDQKARAIDEGADTIMTNSFLWNCAEFRPQTRHDLFNARMMGKVPRYVSLHFEEVLDTLKRGQRLGEQGPTVQEILDRNADKLESFRQFKRANPNAKPQEVQMSVAATMQRLVENGEMNKVVATTEDVKGNDAGPLVARSMISTLWGSMKPETPLQYLDPGIARRALESVMPLQNYIDSTQDTSSPATFTAGIQVEPMAQTITTDNDIRIVSEPDHDVFALGDIKKKRKASNTIDTNSDNVSLTYTSDDSAAHKVTDDGEKFHGSEGGRAAKRAAKKARKEAEKAAAAAVVQDYKPFDYANAQSILHAQPETNGTGTPTPKEKALNPFAKALDTSTGARRNRMGKELAGKSHTFKS
ncbi:exosome nuclease subunit [Neophaeococcomyces mojaviensis]|uniref:Exosome nuclease subunit n=1 Tax=Neophaeococcomyces mojaviensis TaxID=3383035 RepID=A0ACC3A2Y0_9EURO|nr:exosome nuclease subunit [Knufia sp. JES_112]